MIVHPFPICGSSLTHSFVQPAVTSIRLPSLCAELEASMQRSTGQRPGRISVASAIFIPLIETHRRPFAQPARQEPGRFEGEVEGVQMQMLDEGSVVDHLRDRQVDTMLHFGCRKTRTI